MLCIALQTVLDQFFAEGDGKQSGQPAAVEYAKVLKESLSGACESTVHYSV